MLLEVSSSPDTPSCESVELAWPATVKPPIVYEAEIPEDSSSSFPAAVKSTSCLPAETVKSSFTAKEIP